MTTTTTNIDLSDTLTKQVLSKYAFSVFVMTNIVVEFPAGLGFCGYADIVGQEIKSEELISP